MVNVSFKQHGNEYVLKVEGETPKILSSLEAPRLRENLNHAMGKVMNTEDFHPIAVEGFDNSYGYAELMEIHTSMGLVLFPELGNKEIESFLEDVWNKRNA